MTDTNKQLFAVIGDPIGHSLSPAMHNAAFREAGKNAEYTAIQVKPEDFSDFLKQARVHLTGFNVTVPHKQSAANAMDICSEQAKLSGSVNTVSVKAGRLSGDTTDGAGFERAVRESFGYELSGARMTLLGCGGAARAIAFHAALNGVKALHILNRTQEKAEDLKLELLEFFPQLECFCGSLTDTERARELLNDSTMAVQCTSVGLKADDPPVIAPELFPQDIFFFDTIYKPNALQNALADRGIPTENGMLMLLHQGAAAYEIWFQEEAPLEAMRHALASSI